MSKLIALVPILGTAIVLQARTATVDIHEKPQQTIDRVYDVVEQMPQFPGRQNGKAVRVKYILPVTFFPN